MMRWSGQQAISRRIKYRKFVWLVSIACLTTLSFAVSSQQFSLTERPIPSQPELVDTVCSRIPFLVDSLCCVTDESHSLAVFLEELAQLLQGKDTVVNILHIGDSHIQAGFYSGQVMRLLQETFGNAGRGWIAPFKLAKDNEPFDYFIQSSTVEDWTAGRCTQREPKCPWGPGGIGLQTASNFVDFKIRIAPNRGAGYAFNEVLLFRNKNAVPMLPVGAHCENVDTYWGVDVREGELLIDTFRITSQIDSLHLHTAFANELPEHSEELLATDNRYYGFVLRNGHPGVLYHSVGHNGAVFANYTNRDFIRQLSLFEPSLLIISLGTNEAFRAKFDSDEFEMQVDQCIRLIKEYMPNAAILLTTPAECYRRVRKKGYLRNANIENVAGVISEYARKEQLACFDLYEMTGGRNSCVKWQQASFYGRDRIHFKINGYEEQGKLLYKGLIRLNINNQSVLAGE